MARAGEALVKVDPVVRDAEEGQGLALGGEVLQDDGAPGVADEFTHPGRVPFSLPSPDSLADHPYETTLPQVSGPGVRASGCLARGSSYGGAGNNRAVITATASSFLNAGTRAGGQRGRNRLSV